MPILTLPSNWQRKLARWLEWHEKGESVKIKKEASRLTGEQRDGMRWEFVKELEKRKWLKKLKN